VIEEVVKKWLLSKGFQCDGWWYLCRGCKMKFWVNFRGGVVVREGDMWESDFVIYFGDPDFFVKIRELLK